MDDNEGRGERLPAEITHESVEGCLPSQDPKTLAATCGLHMKLQINSEGLQACMGGVGVGGGREACLSRESRPLEALRWPTSHLPPTGSTAVTGPSSPFVSLTPRLLPGGVGGVGGSGPSLSIPIPVRHLPFNTHHGH